MTLALLPDVVSLVRSCLLESTDVTDLVGQRVATSSPADTSEPWIRLQRIGGPISKTAPQRIDYPNVQIDCFAPPEPSGELAAMTLARTVRACMFAAAGYTDGEGIIAYVTEPLGPKSQPDTSRTPPTPRVHFTLAITTRPA
jgi:hypothetical protein